ncbi:uncharacterized protein TNCT_530011 [Trichonephila clavata]|uniref:Uncharacterized protein n=1 Tax=Trichonephila clavata TaxID=2740835 RepID=A0A8X6K714_TRICU|nr:uncharacterized protein TNCT_530011 [Trichonephila clavata]
MKTKINLRITSMYCRAGTFQSSKTSFQSTLVPVAFLRLEINMINTMTMLLKITFCIAVICTTLPDATEATTIADMLDNEAATTTVDPFRFLKLCSPGSERRNTCEKCTKVTRDPKTYKMCCENISGVGRWCRTFLDYTLPPRVVGIY